MTDADLRELAEAATPGPWHAERFFRAGDTPETPGRYRIFLLGASNPKTNSRDCDWTFRDAAFIAAANPTTVLSLLNRLEQAEAERDALRRPSNAAFRQAMAERDQAIAERDQAVSHKNELNDMLNQAIARAEQAEKALADERAATVKDGKVSCATCGRCRGEVCAERDRITRALDNLAANLATAGGLCRAFRLGFDAGWGCSREGHNAEYSRRMTAELYEEMASGGPFGASTYWDWRPGCGKEAP